MKKILSLTLVSVLISLNATTIALALNGGSGDGTETGEETENTAPRFGGTPIEGRQCPPGAYVTGQDSEGLYYCQEMEALEDNDGDDRTNAQDNCPTIPNNNPNGRGINEAQLDSDNDRVGDLCDLSDRTETVIETLDEVGLDEESTVLNSTQQYNQVLNQLGACLRTNNASHEVCNFGSLTELDGKDQRQFERLYNALLNQEIITTLEEPISNENIFRKARVCSTKFLRDKNGVVQPTTNVDLYDSSLTQEELVARFNELNFLITNDKCEEFFVQRCTPKLSTNATVGAGDPLPTRVFCSQVQLIFASSGSELVKNYVGLIYRWAAGIIGVIAVIVMIVNGIIISASGGESGTIENAKNRIVQSLVGLAILFLSGIILFSINPNFFRSQDLQPGIQSPTEEAPLDEEVPNESDSETNE